MLTMNCLIKRKFPIDDPIPDHIIMELYKENEGNNYSYVALMKEYINVTNPITVRDLLKGYSGIKLFRIN